MALGDRGHIPSSRRAAFARGLRVPHAGLPLLGLLLAVGAVATLVAIVAGGDYVGIPEERLLRLAGDDATHISYQVGLVNESPPEGVPVYVLGGSAMREATVSDASLARALSARSGTPTAAVTFAGNEQSFAHDRAIIENLPPAGSRGGIVVLGVGFERFVRSTGLERGEAAEEGLLLPGGAMESLDDVGPDYPRLEGTGGDDTGLSDPRESLALARELSRYVSTYVREHAGDLLSFELPYTSFVRHRYTPDGAWSAARKRAALVHWYETSGRPGSTFDQVFPASARELERTVAAARERGFTVVLVEQPYDLWAAAGRLDRVRARSRALCMALAAEHEGVYLDFLAGARLGSDDFHDVSHLLPSGRPKFQAGLVSGLAPVVAATATGPRQHASLSAPGERGVDRRRSSYVR